jgi:hypothetical protein
MPNTRTANAKKDAPPRREVGVYHPSEDFVTAPAHVAVMDSETSGLVAVTGYADEEPDVLRASAEDAAAFAVAHEALRACSFALSVLKSHGLFELSEQLAADKLTAVLTRRDDVRADALRQFDLSE